MASDGVIIEFQDIRRKVGNQIIRAYLLEKSFESGRIERTKASLRGPRDEFKNFDDFFVLRATSENIKFRVLIEANVYQNLRVVATDSDSIAQKEPADIVEVVTDALTHPDEYQSTLLLSQNSRVQAK
ncbi:MAG: hypothetical protein ACXADS_05455 [Candidatus Thorarchaeota archaeon]|jgi:hypothetical protein